jgi:CRP-like cAMP-binding protein
MLYSGTQVSGRLPLALGVAGGKEGAIMNPDDVHDAMCKMSFMHALPAELKSKVARILQNISKLRRVPLGTAWLREGEHSENKGYILLEGAVSIRKQDSLGHSEDAPELLGEIMQFNPQQMRTATVVATEDCVVMRFVWDEFWERAEESLSAPEQEKVKTALEGFAWEHFSRE